MDIIKNIQSNDDSFDVLMSIKPLYAKMIIDGCKKYEFRKHGFSKSIVKVLIYSTKPVGKIIGYFTFDKVLRGTPVEIWKLCSEGASICENDYYKYFGRAKMAFAMKINKVFAMERPISPHEIVEGFRAPNSFMYVGRSIAYGHIGH